MNIRQKRTWTVMELSEKVLLILMKKEILLNLLPYALKETTRMQSIIHGF